MRLFRIFIIVFVFTVAVGAQTRTSSTAKSRTSARAGKAPSRAGQLGKTTKSAKSKKKTTSAASKGKTKQGGGNVSIKGLQNERARIKKEIKQHEQRLRTNERDVKKRLQSLMIINTEIEDKRRTIDTIRRDISSLDGDIVVLERQLKELEAQLADRKDKYVKSMRYMHRNRSIQNQMMFVFSAKNFTQMYRRLRFTREYAAYQRAQGEAVKAKQEEITEKCNALTATKRQKSSLLTKGEQERRNLETKQTEQQQVVNTLQKQQKTIQQLIEKQREKDAALNAQIDRLVAEEVERARLRAEAEAKRRAEAEAARQRAAELARKKAEAEAAGDNGAQASDGKGAKDRTSANRSSRGSGQSRRSASRNTSTGAGSRNRDVATAKSSGSSDVFRLDAEDRRISGGFESNRGRLPMPITGPYRIINRFGQYNVDGLRNVRLDNKGINIEGQAGAKARSIFDGEVSAVFSFAGSMGVMVRHGSYISVYCNLSSVSVHKGQKVTTRQTLGAVGPDNVLQFQLRREKAKLNPEAWLGR